MTPRFSRVPFANLADPRFSRVPFADLAVPRPIRAASRYGGADLRAAQICLCQAACVSSGAEALPQAQMKRSAAYKSK